MCRHLRVQGEIQNCFARIILHNWKNHEGRIVWLQVWLTVDVCGREIPCARQNPIWNPASLDSEDFHGSHSFSRYK